MSPSTIDPSILSHVVAPTGAVLQPLQQPLGDRVPEDLARKAVHQAQTALGLVRPPPAARPLISVRGEPPPRVVLGFGLGCDSSAILARWLSEPLSRDFALNELAVVTAMTGQEWPATRLLVDIGNPG
ncbi:hypothetical protein [Nocardia sp. NRRL S-836]|uniref:hypothetical protein n=1 Tax=Nocardia sp. NRRL S-836 TaxID=1519492 RepID=UPI000A455F8C|nr:hypothetical protein [Nocardia sp. NRRL S-836]